jgi:hypothetical protein
MQVTETNQNKWRRAIVAASAVNIYDMAGRPGRVGADCKRGERQRGWLARRRDERPMNDNLQIVVFQIHESRLIEEEHVLAFRVPAYCKQFKVGTSHNTIECTHNDRERSQSTCSERSQALRLCVVPIVDQQSLEGSSTC